MQLPLPLALPSKQTLDSFIFEDNLLLKDALLQINTISSKNALLMVHGAHHSGKTHLATAAYQHAISQSISAYYLDLSLLFAPEILTAHQAASNTHSETLMSDILAGYEGHELLVVDNMHVVAGNKELEIALFDLINRCIESACAMVLTSALGPAHHDFCLPDLRSRLTWGQVYHIHPLTDDGLLQAVTSYVQTRGLNMQINAISYLLKFSTRDFSSIQRVIDELDKVSLSHQQAITIPLIKKVLHI